MKLMMRAIGLHLFSSHLTTFSNGAVGRNETCKTVKYSRVHVVSVTNLARLAPHCHPLLAEPITPATGNAVQTRSYK